MACLYITEGKDTGRKLALEQHRLVMVGRDGDCTFQVLDDQISRHHLQVKLERGTGSHFAVDHKSTNGVFVNGIRIAQDTKLENGDEIRIGGTTLLYVSDDSPEALRAVEAMKKGGERFRGTIVGKNLDGS